MIIVANFKMNLTLKKVKEYVGILFQEMEFLKKNQVILLPHFMSLLPQQEIQPITLGVQNAYPAFNGAFSGEVGLEALEELGIGTLLIGHSERRQLLSESQQMCCEKFAFYKEHGFQIIYCIGEPLEVFDKGEEAVHDYLKQQLLGIDVSYPKLIVAYEPIWAIGTGRSAEITQINNTHAKIKELIVKMGGSSNIPLLYGGSVKASNAKAILSQEHVEGVLVGSAALSPYELIEILKVTIEAS